MDLVGPLPETPRGYKYLMTLTDYYTKWAEAYPIKDKTALSVAAVLYTVSHLYKISANDNIIVKSLSTRFIAILVKLLLLRSCAG